MAHPGLVVLALVVAVDAQSGRTDKDLRVVVRVVDAADEKILIRLEGQASDLPVTLIPVRDAAAPATATEQVAAATASALREKADAVVWFSYSHCPDNADSNVGAPTIHIHIHIAQLRTRSILTRVIGDPKCGSSPPAPASMETESASLEIVAIVVRNALVAIAEGGTIGVATPPSPSPPPEGARARLSTGWLMVLDGLVPQGYQGLAATVGVGGSRYGAELAVSATLPAVVTDDLTTVALSRTTIALGGVASTPLGATVVGSIALHAGAMLQNRTTTARSPDVVATPNSRHASVMGSAELRLAWSLKLLRGLAAVIGVAGDYVPAIPIIAYERGPDLLQPRRPWVVQPRVTVGFELRLR